VSYRPYSDNRFYPGLISEDRQEKLLAYDFELAEVTSDDLVWLLSKSAGAAYVALEFVLDKFGEDAAQELARELGYQTGKSIFSRFRDSIGVPPGEALTPEQFVKFQDLAHAMMGVDTMYAFSDYDDERAWVSRQRVNFGGCGPITHAPPRLRSICTYAELGFISAYKELQPTLVWENFYNLGDPEVTGAIGRAISAFVMWMKIPEHVVERAAGRE